MPSFFAFIFTFLCNYDIVFAIPRFAVSNGASCIACHVNPTGSAMRNSHGNDVVALEELPLKRWMNKGDDDWDGHVTDQIQLGGDFRLQGVQFNDTHNTQKSSFFSTTLSTPNVISGSLSFIGIQQTRQYFFFYFECTLILFLFYKHQTFGK